MLMIRLMRFGRKHQPFFRLVVVPKRGKPDRAKYVESVGWVDPGQHKHSVNAERVKHWLGVGAQPSDTAWNLFVREGIVTGAKRPVHARAVLEKEKQKEVLPQMTEESTSQEVAPAENEQVSPAEDETPVDSGKEDERKENGPLDTETKE